MGPAPKHRLIPPSRTATGEGMASPGQALTVLNLVVSLRPGDLPSDSGSPFHQELPKVSSPGISASTKDPDRLWQCIWHVARPNHAGVAHPGTFREGGRSSERRVLHLRSEPPGSVAFGRPERACLSRLGSGTDKGYHVTLRQSGRLFQQLRHHLLGSNLALSRSQTGALFAHELWPWK